MSKHIAQRKFVDFLKNYRETSADGPTKYIDDLDHDPVPKTLSVSIDDIKAHCEDLHEALRTNPAEYLPLLELAASEVVTALRFARAEDHEGDEPQPAKHDVQILLSSTQIPKNMRNLTSQDISQLVVIPGIVIAASRAKSKATQIALQCKTCKNIKIIACKPGFGGAMMPRTCDARTGNNIGEEACPLDPFVVLPERSKYTDTQVLKLQENPEDVPVGEMPRNLMLAVDRTLVQRIVPGTRVTVLGIYSIFQQRDKNAGKA